MSQWKDTRAEPRWSELSSARRNVPKVCRKICYKTVLLTSHPTRCWYSPVSVLVQTSNKHQFQQGAEKHRAKYAVLWDCEFLRRIICVRLFHKSLELKKRIQIYKEKNGWKMLLMWQQLKLRRMDEQSFATDLSIKSQLLHIYYYDISTPHVTATFGRRCFLKVSPI